MVDIAALSSESNLELKFRKCACWPGLRSPDTDTPPTLQWLHRPESLSLLSILFGQAQLVQTAIEKLLHTQATLSDVLLLTGRT